MQRKNLGMKRVTVFYKKQNQIKSKLIIKISAELMKLPSLL